MFVDSSITVSENISMVNVQLMRSNPIRQNVTVRVLGGEGYFVNFLMSKLIVLFSLLLACCIFNIITATKDT